MTVTPEGAPQPDQTTASRPDWQESAHQFLDQRDAGGLSPDAEVMLHDLANSIIRHRLSPADPNNNSAEFAYYLVIPSENSEAAPSTQAVEAGLATRLLGLLREGPGANESPTPTLPSAEEIRAARLLAQEQAQQRVAEAFQDSVQELAQAAADLRATTDNLTRGARPDRRGRNARDADNPMNSTQPPRPEVQRMVNFKRGLEGTLRAPATPLGLRFSERTGLRRREAPLDPESLLRDFEAGEKIPKTLSWVTQGGTRFEFKGMVGSHHNSGAHARGADDLKFLVINPHNHTRSTAYLTRDQFRTLLRNNSTDNSVF